MSSATVDLRGFVYSLDAILHKNAWDLAWLQTRLAQSSERLRAMQARFREMQEQHRLQKLAVHSALASRIEPSSYQRALAYLVQSQLTLAGEEALLQKMHEECENLRRECNAQGIKMQMLETHRATSLADYVAVEQTRQANEVDRDWSARSVWRQKMTQGMAERRGRKGDA